MHGSSNIFIKISKLLAMGVIIFLTACKSIGYEQQSFKMIANNPLKSRDGGFNQAAWNGMKQVIPKLNEKIDIVYPETQDDPAMITTTVNKVIEDGYRGMVMPGFTYNKTIVQKKFFDTYNQIYFLAVDVNEYEKAKLVNDKAVDKYYEIQVDESKPGFGAAVDIAGQVLEAFKKDKNNMGLPVIRDSSGDVTVRFTGIGGLPIFPIQNYMIGFNKGLRWFQDNVLLQEADTKNGQLKFEWYPATFNGGFGNSDAVKGAQANMQKALENDVGVIFNISVPEASTLLKTIVANESNAWLVGVDVDQASDPNLEGYTQLIKTSALKDVSSSVRDVLTAIEKRIANNNEIDPNDQYSAPGTKSFVWSKTKEVSLVPMGDKSFDVYFAQRIGAQRVTALKDALNVSTQELRACNVNTMLGNIVNDFAVCPKSSSGKN